MSPPITPARRLSEVLGETGPAAGTAGSTRRSGFASALPVPLTVGAILIMPSAMAFAV